MTMQATPATRMGRAHLTSLAYYAERAAQDVQNVAKREYRSEADFLNEVGASVRALANMAAQLDTEHRAAVEATPKPWVKA